MRLYTDLDITYIVIDTNSDSIDGWVVVVAPEDKSSD